MKVTEQLTDLISELIAQALLLESSAYHHGGDKFVPLAEFSRLSAGCKLLDSKLGPRGTPWSQQLTVNGKNFLSFAMILRGTLEAIRDAIIKGRLSTIEEIVSAEILADLLGHADALLQNNFNLAAAIVLRAVLEERLRKLCEANACLPSKDRPTIEDFKQALRGANVIDKLVAKDIDWMAGVGNSAAHNLPEFTAADVPLLYQRMLAFLTRFSVT